MVKNLPKSTHNASKMFHLLLLNDTNNFFTHKCYKKIGRKIFQGAEILILKGGEAEVYIAFKLPWMLNIKAFSLILSHLGGFWQQASEPSKLGVLCLGV
jgi:hypothetical protein